MPFLVWIKWELGFSLCLLWFINTSFDVLSVMYISTVSETLSLLIRL